MREKFSSCKLAIRRTWELEFKALRKLECTYNARRGDYHPHYHVLVQGREAAEMLRMLWLRRWKGATAAAQDVREVDGNGIREIFKYFTKLTTPAVGGKGRRYMSPAVLDTIFQALRGRRVWQPVGFTLPKELADSIEGEELEVSGTQAFKRKEDDVYWEWDQGLNDWLDRGTGELLSEYEPGERFRAFVASIGQEGGAVEMIDDS
jgi:hypothetical protein